MTAAQQIRWKQQTVNVHYPMFIAGHSLLRFSPCYKSGGQFRPLAYNGMAVGAVH